MRWNEHKVLLNQLTGRYFNMVRSCSNVIVCVFFILFSFFWLAFRCDRKFFLNFFSYRVFIFRDVPYEYLLFFSLLFFFFFFFFYFYRRPIDWYSIYLYNLVNSIKHTFILVVMFESYFDDIMFLFKSINCLPKCYVWQKTWIYLLINRFLFVFDKDYDNKQT